MRVVLAEAAAICAWTTFWCAAAAFALRVAAGVPFAVTYILGALTVGPVLAIFRGRDRQRDPLTLAQRAAAEVLALAGLLAIGWLLGRAAA